MTKRKIARSAGSILLSLALAMSGVVPGTSSVNTAYAADTTVTIIPASDADETKQGTGNMEISLSITKAIENNWVTLGAEELPYTGSAQKPTVTVKYTAGNAEQTLTENTDYTITIKDSDETVVAEPVDVGTYTITVNAVTGSYYTGSASKTYKIIKSTPAAPTAPTLDSKTKTSVKLVSAEGCEYSKDGANWQAEPEFTGLICGTEYSFYQRKAATDNTNVSDASEALKVTTDDDTYTMTITLVITPESVLINKINKLPDADKVAATDKDAINEAREAYDALKDEQKGNIPEDVLKKLTDAESALKVIDTNAKLNAIPDEVTKDNKEDIKALVKVAREAYDALNDKEKEKVDKTAFAKLEAAESALKVLDVEDTLNALPEVTKDNKETSEETVKEAREAYEALTKEEQAKVDENALAKLKAAESALKVLDVEEKLNALPGEADVKLEDKDAIKAARAAYDALTDAEKEKVDETALAKLTAAEKALDEAEKKEADDTEAAKKVTDAIGALPASDKVATTDKAAIEEARKAYDALTPDQKKKVSDETLKKLTDAETALATAEKKDAEEEAAKKKDAVDKAAADKVIDAINKLPASDKVATTDKAAIEAARKAYDALTADQKKKVSANVLKKLTDAEKALAAAEKKAAADAAAKAAAEKAAMELAAAKEEAQTAMNEQVTVKQKGNKFTVKWKKSTSADGYYVYVKYCSKNAKLSVTTVNKNTINKVTICKINGKKISKKKNFQIYVVPYKVIAGKKVVLGKSMVAHLVGIKNAKYSNVKKLTLKKSSYAVSVGKTAKIKAKVTLVNKKKKHISKGHGAKFRYKSSDTSIATVDKNGKIKGIKKGICTIYVYSINGLMKKTNVTVK